MPRCQHNKLSHKPDVGYMALRSLILSGCTQLEEKRREEKTFSHHSLTGNHLSPDKTYKPCNSSFSSPSSEPFPPLSKRHTVMGNRYKPNAWAEE